MATRTASARALGSIHSPDLSRQVIQQTTTTATFTTASRTGYWWRRVTSCQEEIRVQPTLGKPPTLARMNIPGASRIQGSATCLTTSPIVNSQSAVVLHFSRLRRLVLPSECNRLSKRGQLRAPQLIRLNPIQVTTGSFLSVTR